MGRANENLPNLKSAIFGLRFLVKANQHSEDAIRRRTQPTAQSVSAPSGVVR